MLQSTTTGEEEEDPSSKEVEDPSSSSMIMRDTAMSSSSSTSSTLLEEVDREDIIKEVPEHTERKSTTKMKVGSTRTKLLIAKEEEEAMEVDLVLALGLMIAPVEDTELNMRRDPEAWEEVETEVASVEAKEEPEDFAEEQVDMVVEVPELMVVPKEEDIEPVVETTIEKISSSFRINELKELRKINMK